MGNELFNAYEKLRYGGGDPSDVEEGYLIEEDETYDCSFDFIKMNPNLDHVRISDPLCCLSAVATWMHGCFVAQGWVLDAIDKLAQKERALNSGSEFPEIARSGYFRQFNRYLGRPFVCMCYSLHVALPSYPWSV